jgi:alpha-N-arabinofuranosidase
MSQRLILIQTMKYKIALLLVAMPFHLASAKEFHVSVNGDDSNKGSASKPFKTISAAARVAQP